MSTGYALLDNPNPNGDHFYTTRRKRLIAQVMHITAGLEDIDLIGPDDSCEAVTRYAETTSREVSWNSGSDTDGFINLLPYSYTAWQCVNYNSSTAGHEISKLETNWRDDNPEVVRRRLYWAAVAIRPNLIKYEIPFRKATKAEVDRAIANNGPPVGLISHHELDPDRRTDPGWAQIGGQLVDTFPWQDFLTILKNPQPIGDWSDMATEEQIRAIVKDETSKAVRGAIEILMYGDRRTDTSGADPKDTHPDNLQRTRQDIRSLRELIENKFTTPPTTSSESIFSSPS